jgi:hypothetical protein
MIETISALVGAVLSLALSFVPGLKDWYDKLETVMKALIFAGLCLAGGIGMAIFSATHGGDFFAVFLSFAKTFLFSWLAGTVTNVPVSKAIRDKKIADTFETHCDPE